MKKIIILSDTGDPRQGLLTQLKDLFPECEIQVLQRKFKNTKEGIIIDEKNLILKRSVRAAP